MSGCTGQRGGSGFPAGGKGKSLDSLSLLPGFIHPASARERARNRIPGDCLSSSAPEMGNKLFEFGGCREEGLFAYTTKSGNESPHPGKEVLLETLPGSAPAPEPLQIAALSLLPAAGEGRAWGRGRAGLGAGPRPRARRLDDRDKMTTLEDGQLGPDPGALSPEQLEKLRDYKVGARPAPRIRAQTGRRTPRAGSLFPTKRGVGAGGKARGEPRRIPGRSSGGRLRVQGALKQGPGPRNGPK